VLQSPQLCAENGISQKTADHLLKHLNEYTVHHLGEKNMLQIVDFATHSAARHTGGISMWGKAGL
ncbi:MAG: HNH endonuclease, partial [Treponema sp.]|nr:HNH endonuclease [Treponema sp.]